MDLTQQPSKLDMSLDDIIKLERKQTSKRGNRGRGAPSQRQTLTNGRNIRVLASRGRFGLRTTSIRGSRGLLRSRFTSSSTLTGRSTQPAATALAVLKRARKTAAAAVRDAKDAAELLQRSRQQRQRIFDARRLSAPTSTAYQDPRGRGRGRKMPVTRRRSFPIAIQANAVRQMRYTDRTQNVPNNQIVRRMQQRRQNISNGRFNRTTVYRSQNVRGVGVRRLQDYVPTQQQNPRFSRQNFQTNGRGRSSFRGRGIGNQSRNAEYLAQARALIQAQSEQSHTGTFSIGTLRRSGSGGRPPRRRGWNF